jgi:hypothetical protein
MSNSFPEDRSKIVATPRQFGLVYGKSPDNRFISRSKRESEALTGGRVFAHSVALKAKKHRWIVAADSEYRDWARQGAFRAPLCHAGHGCINQLAH